MEGGAATPFGDHASSQSSCAPCFKRLWSSGPFIISVAALICSTIPLCVKQLHGKLPSSEVTLISSMMAWALTSIWLLLSGWGMGSLLTTGKTPLLVLRGLLGGAVQVLYYSAIQILSMNEAVSLFFTNPAFAVMLDWMINGKRINLSTLVGCVTTIGGVYLIMHPTCAFPPILNWAGSGSTHLGSTGGAALPNGSLSGARALFRMLLEHTNSTTSSSSSSLCGHGPHTLGVAVALAASITNAAAFITISATGPGVPFVVLMWYYHTLASAAAGASFLASGATWVLPDLSQMQWITGVAAANFFGQLLLNRGFQQEDASHGAAINTQQVLYSYLWNITILRQPLQLCAALGSAAILGGVVAVTESSGQSQEEAELERFRSQLSSLANSSKLGSLPAAWHANVLPQAATAGSVVVVGSPRWRSDGSRFGGAGGLEAPLLVGSHQDPESH